MRWIIDAGHGGMLWDCYLTKGKRSPQKKYPSDRGVFEGEFNRNMAMRLHMERGKGNLLTIPGVCDATIRGRVKAINQVASRYRWVALISLHANASGFGRKWRPANGLRVFHSRSASSGSILLARLIDTQFRRITWHDGTTAVVRPIAAKNFGIIKRPKCPAVLVECGFMTSELDIIHMQDSFDRNLLVQAIANAMSIYEGYAE